MLTFLNIKHKLFTNYYTNYYPVQKNPNLNIYQLKAGYTLNEGYQTSSNCFWLVFSNKTIYQVVQCSSIHDTSRSSWHLSFKYPIYPESIFTDHWPLHITLIFSHKILSHSFQEKYFNICLPLCDTPLLIKTDRYHSCSERVGILFSTWMGDLFSIGAVHVVEWLPIEINTYNTCDSVFSKLLHCRSTYFNTYVTGNVNNV